MERITMTSTSDLKLNNIMVKNILLQLGMHLNITALLILSVSAIEPRFVPSFVIDFDQPASSRYDDLFSYFKEPILQMENYFYYSIPPQIRGFYGEGDNL